MPIVAPFAFIRGVAPAPTSPQTFTWVSNGDPNDLFYFLGRNQGTAGWTNPDTAGYVTVIRSSSLNGADSDYVNRAVEYNTTDNNSGEWIAVDIGTDNNSRLIVVSDYSLRAGNDGTPGQAIRNWKLQGSNNVATNDITGVNAATWVDIDVRTADASVGVNQGDWGHLILGSTPAGYRFLRILNTGANSSGLNFIQLSEIQVYGDLTF